MTIAAVLICLTAGAGRASSAAAHDPIPGKTARTIVATWRCQDQLGITRARARSPWKAHSAGFRQAELRRWQNRWRACTWQLKERARQWNWREFTTPMERAVAMCETGINWSHRTSDYEGAYGFYRGSWDAFKPAGYPDAASDATPWQQTVVMRRIRDRYGWSGWGCVTHDGYLHWLGRV